MKAWNGILEHDPTPDGVYVRFVADGGGTTRLDAVPDEALENMVGQRVSLTIAEESPEPKSTTVGDYQSELCIVLARRCHPDEEADVAEVISEAIAKSSSIRLEFSEEARQSAGRIDDALRERALELAAGCPEFSYGIEQNPRKRYGPEVYIWNGGRLFWRFAQPAPKPRPANPATATAERMCAEWPWLTDEQRERIHDRSQAMMGEHNEVAVAVLCAMATRFAVENQLERTA